MHRIPGALLAFTLLLSVPRTAGAQSDPPRYDPGWHGALAAGGFIGAGLVVWAERDDAVSCKWCGVGASGAPAAPRVDRWARSHWNWEDEGRAAMLSHIAATSAYAWPLAALTAVHGGTGDKWGRDQLAVASSLGIAQLAADLTKRGFRRARPSVVFDRQPGTQRDDVHSFVSGHTATTFAAAVAAGTIASRRQSPDAAWIWAGGISLAATTGYLRVAGDRHFFTDVIAGAAVGTAIGMLMPRLFDQGGDVDPEASTAPRRSIVGLGPVARVSDRSRLPVTLQFGAGSRAVGIVGTVRRP